MRILITGGTGFIGAQLLPALSAGGHEIVLLSRQQRPCGGRYPSITHLDQLPDNEHIDAIINLAGASLAGRRWSAAYKRELVASRVDTTRSLISLIQRLDSRPAVLLSASAIGFYGHHGDEMLSEDGASVPGFAQSLCQAWEQVAGEARELGVRVCNLRLGVVLDRDGGALQQMLLPFRLGVGNYVGDGSQWFSWIHRKDAVAAMQFLLDKPTLDGPFNLTAPHPVTARAFCEAIQQHKRTLLTLPMPAAVMRLMMGEMAEELLIAGQRVLPTALELAGFSFRYPTVDGALADILGA